MISASFISTLIKSSRVLSLPKTEKLETFRIIPTIIGRSLRVGVDFIIYSFPYIFPRNHFPLFIFFPNDNIPLFIFSKK